MHMVRLIYASTVAKDFDPGEIEKIMKVARERNSREKMTGVLFFTADHFVQCLEGDSRAVNMLYNDMMRDPRHRDLVILSYGDIKEPMFASWQMAYIGPGDISNEILAAHTGAAVFNPYDINEAMANAMLILLVKHLEDERRRSFDAVKQHD